MSGFYEVLRWVNIVLYGAVLSGVIMHWRHLFDPQEVPGGRGWLVAWVSVAMYSTIEVLFLNTSGGPRVIANTLVLLGFVWSLYVKPVQHLIRKSRRHARTLEDNRVEGSR